MIAPRDPEAASLPRRAVAGVTDLLTVLAGLGACVGAALKLGGRLGARDLEDTASRRWDRLTSSPRIVAMTESKALRLAVRVLSVACVDVPLRNWQSPGARVVGIRLVDARTRGPVTVTSAILDELAGVAFGHLTRPLISVLRRRSEAEQARLQQLAPQVAALQREHADDPTARREAMIDFYRAHHVNPLNSLAWLLPGALLMPFTAVFSSRRQTLRQHVAGTLVVRSR